MPTMYVLRQVSLDHGDCTFVSNSNSGADDIQKTNQKLISHSFEAGKNYSQKEGGTHCGVFLDQPPMFTFGMSHADMLTG